MVRRGCFSISQSFLERDPRSNVLGYPVLREAGLIGVDGEYCYNSLRSRVYLLLFEDFSSKIYIY